MALSWSLIYKVVELATQALLTSIKLEAAILATFFLPVDDFTTRRKAPKNHG